MASVYYLFDDAVHVDLNIVQHYTQEKETLKLNHQAAVTIQRYYRGYVVRKYLKKLHRSALMIQKYVRGWLVRYKMPDFWHKEYDRMCWIHFNKMAAKIQALWRGVMTRKKIPIKEILEEKRKQEEEAEQFGNSFGKSKKKRHKNKSGEDADDSSSESSDSEESEDETAKPCDQFYVEQILQMLFDRHHLLSTYSMKGTFASSKQNQRELSEIEKILSSFPWKSYMKRCRKIYNDTISQLSKSDRRIQYMFENPKLRKQEDLLRLKYEDKKMENAFGDSHKKPCLMKPNLKEPPYEPSLMNQDQYKVRETRILRTEDPSKNISETDFKLVFRDLVEKCDVPVYYADFWYNSCSIHNLK